MTDSPLSLVSVEPQEPLAHELAFISGDPINSPAHPVFQYLITLRSKGSQKVMMSNLDRVARTFGLPDASDIQWEQLRHFHVQHFINESLSRNLAPNSINTCLSAIKGVVKQAWMSKMISVEDYQRIKEIRGVRGGRVSSGRALSLEEVQLLFQDCSSDENTIIAARDAAILSLFVGCGFRRAELASLNVGDYSPKTGMVRVIGKGNKERVNPVPDQLRPFVDDWLSIYSPQSDESPLFVRIRRHQSLTNVRLRAQGVCVILEKRGMAKGLDQFTPHDLRRTFATTLFNNGEDIRTVQIALGHNSIETTKLYDKSGETRKNKATRNLRFL